MKRRILCILMVVVMAFVMVAACTPDAPTVVPDPTPTPEA